MIVFRIVTLPVKVGTKTGLVASKVGYRTARFVGFKRLVLIGIGVGIGLLIAPLPGREMRERLGAKLRRLTSTANGGDLGSPPAWPPADPQPATAAGDSRFVVSGTNGHA